MPAGAAPTPRRTLLFTEVRDRLLGDIADGRLGVGDRLPSEPDLAVSYGISRPTLREVLRSLETDGIVRRVHGVGTFVTAAEPLVRTALDLDVGVTEAIAAAHATLGIEVVRIDIAEVPTWAAAPLALAPGGQVLTVERVIRANGTPAVHGLDLIPASLLPASGATTYDGGSVYRFLETECHVHLVGGVAEVTAVTATPGLARHLDVARTSPLLRLDQVEKAADGRPVLFSREHYAPGVFSLSVRRLRHQRADLGERQGHAAQPSPPAGGTEVQPGREH